MTLGLEERAWRCCATGLAERSRLAVSWRISECLPGISGDAELVIYRVAQEALTKRRAPLGLTRGPELSLQPADGRVVLTVRDAGARPRPRAGARERDPRDARGAPGWSAPRSRSTNRDPGARDRGSSSRWPMVGPA